jgi:DNA sulfur modification protein DndB
LLGEVPETISPDELERLERLALRFWSRLTDIVEPWSAIAAGEIRASDARRDYVSSYGVALWGIAAAARTAMAQGGLDALDALASVDWRKTNPEWQGICMVGGEIVTRQPTRRATADYLRFKLGLGSRPLPVLPSAPT